MRVQLLKVYSVVKKIFFVLVAITTFAQPGGDKVKLSHWLYNIREITIKRDIEKKDIKRYV